MKTAFNYALLAAVTLGIMSVPHALFYEHPDIVLDTWFRGGLSHLI